jgi:hypothetical protein
MVQKQFATEDIKEVDSEFASEERETLCGEEACSPVTFENSFNNYCS